MVTKNMSELSKECRDDLFSRIIGTGYLYDYFRSSLLIKLYKKNFKVGCDDSIRMPIRVEEKRKIYHGGCVGCNQPQHICSDCQYKNADWNLPDLNSTTSTCIKFPVAPLSKEDYKSIRDLYFPTKLKAKEIRMKARFYTLKKKSSNKVIICLLLNKCKDSKGHNTGKIEIARGIAVCSEDDKFDNDKGKLIAKKRAEHAMKECKNKAFKSKRAIDILIDTQCPFCNSLEYNPSNISFFEKKLLFGNPNYKIDYNHFHKGRIICEDISVDCRVHTDFTGGFLTGRILDGGAS